MTLSNALERRWNTELALKYRKSKLEIFKFTKIFYWIKIIALSLLVFEIKSQTMPFGSPTYNVFYIGLLVNIANANFLQGTVFSTVSFIFHGALFDVYAVNFAISIMSFGRERSLYRWVFLVVFVLSLCELLFVIYFFINNKRDIFISTVRATNDYNLKCKCPYISSNFRCIFSAKYLVLLSDV